MLRTALVLLVVATAPAHGQSMFDICKGESKTSGAGTGKPSIAVVYLSDFPVTPADAKAAACLEKALAATQLRCPREATVLTVKTAICL